MEILKELLPFVKGYLIIGGVLSVVVFVVTLIFMYKVSKSKFKD
ncbi:hypothetical protein [Clostridium tetani]|nr:hypothetical protein [Clostridium tetani]